MNVVHVVRQFRPSVGGLEDAVISLVRNQRAAGVDARVVTLDRIFIDLPRRLPRSGVVDGIPVTRLRWRGSTRYPVAPGVLRAVRGADLIHVHAVDFFFDYLAATWPLHGKPMVATTHGGFFHTDRRARFKRLWFNIVTRRRSGPTMPS